MQRRKRRTQTAPNLGEALPEECIEKIVSHTTPVDASRLSLVSRTFYSAAQSDIVWDHFLPSDFMSIISRSDSQSSLLANSPSKKSLYLALSDNPIIIDNATKSFQLDKKSGKKCYMLAAGALTILPGDATQYWNGTTRPIPKSRFPEVAELIRVCSLEIRGVINTNALSPNTQYVAYLVFNMLYSYGFDCRPVELSVDIVGGQSSTKNVCLEPINRQIDERNLRRERRMRRLPARGLPVSPGSLHGVQRPNVRSDGWLEIEMGEFFNTGLEDDEVHMSVLETKGGDWKEGLIIEGIEVRPKEANLAPKEPNFPIEVFYFD